MHFNELGINPAIIEALGQLGFVQPTEIQEKTIPLLLQGTKDLIGLAQTGTGKTAAFGIPLLHMIDPAMRHVQAIVLCPTRELCVQIERELRKYSAQLPAIKITALYGGSDIAKQIHALTRGTHIIVGTPGRVIDHLQRKTLKLNDIRVVVLDEADEMLSMGFQEDIDTILQTTPTNKKTWLFSATMPQEVERIISNYMSQPARVTVGNKNGSARNITHKHCVVSRTNRYPALRRIIDVYPDFFGIVFCRTRSDAQEVAHALIKDGYLADALHGDLSQTQRENVMRKLRNRVIRIIVATDVAARGIDITDLTHVIHYNLPEKIENYTHRSGRTARAGKSGVSIALIGNRDIRYLKQIERIIGAPIEYMTIPDSATVCATNVEHTVRAFIAHETQDAEQVSHFHTARALLEELPKEALVDRILMHYAHRIMKLHGNGGNLNESIAARSSYPERAPYHNRSGQYRRPHHTNNNSGHRRFGHPKRYAQRNTPPTQERHNSASHS
jgi:ATP-dependent RNA helicase DeaD